MQVHAAGQRGSWQRERLRLLCLLLPLLLHKGKGLLSMFMFWLPVSQCFCSLSPTESAVKRPTLLLLWLPGWPAGTVRHPPSSQAGCTAGLRLPAAVPSRRKLTPPVRLQRSTITSLLPALPACRGSSV